MRATRYGAMVAVASATFAVVVAFIVIGRPPEHARATPNVSVTAGVPSPSSSALPSTTSTPSRSVSPTLSPPATAVPTPAAATSQAFATIAPQQLEALVPPQTHGIGQLAGDWVFMLRRSTVFGSLPHSSGGEQIAATDRASDSLTFVPLAGAETRAVTVATFLSDLGAGIAATNLVGAQLSPDGGRVVLSVGTKGPQGGERLGLVIIDLANGGIFNLTTDPSYHDDTPTWSPDGRQIAFTRRSVFDGSDAGIWAIAPQAGSTARGPFLRPVAVAGRRSLVYGWTPDGVWLAISRGNDRYEFLNVPPESCGTAGVCAGGNLADMEGNTSDVREIADWRRTMPQFVGVFGENQSGGFLTIEVAEAPTVQRRAVVRAANPNVLLQRPRWRPGSDEFLYLETQIATGPRTVRLKIADARTTAQREVLFRQVPFWAEWTPAGDEIAWVETNGIAVGVRVVRADGGGERAIYGTGGAPEGQMITVDFGTLRF